MLRSSALVTVALVACSPATGDKASPAASTQAPAPKPPAEPVAIQEPARCEPNDRIGFLVSPRAPSAGHPLRVLVTSEDATPATLVIRRAGEDVKSAERAGGPPYWWRAEVAAPPAGEARALLVEGDRVVACADIAIADAPPEIEPRRWGSVWPVRAAWNVAYEDLYSAWIEHLFDAPVGEQLSWHALHEVLKDRDRNLLHDYLGANEDDAYADVVPQPGAPPLKGPHAYVVDPDCADLPYVLRAYFAFKMGLPFGYSACTRGGGGQSPRCVRWHSNLEDGGRKPGAMETFVDFLRITLADTVHSGTGRAPADESTPDYYPVKLAWTSLRPGAIYADPYGHVFVIAKHLAQTDEAGGVLLAVDGQPDATVARKRYWRGNFLFAEGPGMGSPGFKRFRPVVVEGGRARQMTNDEIAKSPTWGDFSLEQYEGPIESFYDRMDDVLSPAPLDPSRALVETIQALEEQVKGRLLGVANGVKYVAANGTIDMPDAKEIFETTGPWEDFSTPSRDLRILIAIDVARGFPERVARRPERFALPQGRAIDDVKKTLEQELAAELDKRKLTYERSDGSTFELRLADVVERAAALEVAYNPNDCPEVRWGAPAGSDEMKTCRRRAPGDQAAKMRRARPWFHARRRPPRP